MKKFTLNLKVRIEDGKEIEKVCMELEKHFPNHNFHAIKKRIVPDGYKPNRNYGP